MTWPIAPFHQTPQDVDVSRPEANTRPRLDSRDATKQRSRKRKRRKREERLEDLNVDTFERAADLDEDQ